MQKERPADCDERFHPRFLSIYNVLVIVIKML